MPSVSRCCTWPSNFDLSRPSSRVRPSFCFPSPTSSPVPFLYCNATSRLASLYHIYIASLFTALPLPYLPSPLPIQCPAPYPLPSSYHFYPSFSCLPLSLPLLAFSPLLYLLSASLNESLSPALPPPCLSFLYLALLCLKFLLILSSSCDFPSVKCFFF